MSSEHWTVKQPGKAATVGGALRNLNLFC
uniref:Uncharacterized protein n=1 Tax=Rhizophora mucronata TaxID=61149 RepID=A0A2P2NAJ7_RHIMU